MKSKVLTKIVLVTEGDEICFCDKEFRKTCLVRISGKLSCRESVIRITPVERGPIGDDTPPEYITAMDVGLRNVKHSFMKTLEHLARNKK